MRRIAVINQKGGVGKTTTAANLGAALAASGATVLLIDLDPQAHLSLYFGVDVANEQRSVYDVLTASTPLAEVAVGVRDRVTLIPADIDLAGAESELISVTGREVLLREAISTLANDYDYLLIDCPPSLGVLTVNALAAADEVLIPLQAHFLALQGLGRLLDTVTLVRQRINPALKVGGVVLCMHESTTRLASEVVDDLMRFLAGARDTTLPWADAVLYETCIRRNIKLAESASFGQTVFDYAPRSHGAQDYTRLAAEVLGEPAIPRPGASVSAARAPTPTEQVEAAGSNGRDLSLARAKARSPRSRAGQRSGEANQPMTLTPARTPTGERGEAQTRAPTDTPTDTPVEAPQAAPKDAAPGLSIETPPVPRSAGSATARSSQSTADS